MKGEESAEAKIKSFDEVTINFCPKIMVTCFVDCTITKLSEKGRLILSFPQIHQKYKFMESSLASRRRKLKAQVES